MIIVRKSEERRHPENKDPNNWMTFDPENKADSLRNGFAALKILNEEMLSPSSGFVLQPLMDMVVITYVREGVIIYKGPLEETEILEGNDFHKVDVAPGTKQYVFNFSQTEDAQVFQCGFISSEGLAKSGGIKKFFTHAERHGILKLIASSDGKEASLRVHQDIQMYSTFLHKRKRIIHELGPGRSAWIHVVKGRILLNDLALQTGDGAGLTDARFVSFMAESPAEILLFDLCGPIPENLKDGLYGN